MVVSYCKECGAPLLRFAFFAAKPPCRACEITEHFKQARELQETRNRLRRRALLRAATRRAQDGLSSAGKGNISPTHQKGCTALFDGFLSAAWFPPEPLDWRTMPLQYTGHLITLADAGDYSPMV